MAVAATASGGETMAPNAKAAAHPMSGTKAWTTTATATMVASTRPTASSEIGRMLCQSSRGEVKKAAENRIGGRMTRKTISGASSMRGMPGTRPINTPPTVIRIG